VLKGLLRPSRYNDKRHASCSKVFKLISKTPSELAGRCQTRLNCSVRSINWHKFSILSSFTSLLRTTPNRLRGMSSGPTNRKRPFDVARSGNGSKALNTTPTDLVIFCHQHHPYTQSETKPDGVKGLMRFGKLPHLRYAFEVSTTSIVRQTLSKGLSISGKI
jgi:hypothetical protein